MTFTGDTITNLDQLVATHFILTCRLCQKPIGEGELFRGIAQEAEHTSCSTAGDERSERIARIEVNQAAREFLEALRAAKGLLETIPEEDLAEEMRRTR